MISHFSTFDVTDRAADLLFPGAAQTARSHGYVRAQTRAALAGDRRRRRPWRDYPNGARTDVRQLLSQVSHTHVLIAGARNVINEFGYAARIDGVWHRRAGDQPLPEHWPCIEAGAKGVRFIHLSQATPDGNLLTGVPAVINGVPISRAEVLRHSSDVAHAFHVHPQGAIGPPAPAWAELSETWETCHQANTDPVAPLMACGQRHGATESKHLLWGLLVEHSDGGITLAAITGALSAIGQTLAARGARNAIVLDTGGSVGWWYRRQPDDEPLLLLAGPNYRATGLVFLRFYLDDFPQPRAHGALATLD